MANLPNGFRYYRHTGDPESDSEYVSDGFRGLGTFMQAIVGVSFYDNRPYRLANGRLSGRYLFMKIV